MTSALAPVSFDAPLVNPASIGLLAAVAWQADSGPHRWLGPGVDVRMFNYGGGSAFGVWTATWDAAHSDLDPEDDVKSGERPEMPDTFEAFTSWAYDEGALPEWSQEEVRVRAEQTHRLQEPNAVETAFATRLLTDGATPTDVVDVVAAVSALESELAKTGTVGAIHAGAQWAGYAAQANLIVRGGSGGLRTPLGNQWIFGGGYVDALDTVLVATSPVFGWRGPVEVRDAVKTEHNRYAAIAERSLLVGYEAAVVAVDIVGPEEP